MSCSSFSSYFYLTFFSYFRYLFGYLFQVVSVGMINATDQHDIIPESVALGGTFRAFSNNSFYHLRRRIEEVEYKNYDMHVKQVKTEIM
jgi:metal-dependent amidase/aminoacylase/carboxypeptidase family protein